MKRRNFISSVVSGAALAPMACGAVEKSEIKKLKRKLMSSLSDTGEPVLRLLLKQRITEQKSSFLKRCRLGVVTLQSPGAESLSPRAVQMPKNSLMEPLILPIMKRAQNLSRFSVGRSGSKCPGC